MRTLWALLVLPACLLASAPFCAQPRKPLLGQDAVESYRNWYRLSMQALASDGVISPTTTDAAVAGLAAHPEFRAALAALAEGRAADSKAALVALATEQKLGFGALREKARTDRDWVLSELARRNRPVPEDLAARPFITSQERDTFALGQPVNWKLPGPPVADPGDWEGTLPDIPPLPAAVPFDLSQLWLFYRQYLAGGAR